MKNFWFDFHLCWHFFQLHLRPSLPVLLFTFSKWFVFCHYPYLWLFYRSNTFCYRKLIFMSYIFLYLAPIKPFQKYWFFYFRIFFCLLYRIFCSKQLLYQSNGSRNRKYLKSGFCCVGPIEIMRQPLVSPKNCVVSICCTTFLNVSRRWFLRRCWYFDIFYLFNSQLLCDL